MRTTNKVIALVGGGALVVATAGAAYAYWSTTGSGSGTAATSTGTVDKLTFSSTTSNGTAAIGGMAPGIAASALQSTVTNTGDENTYVSGIKAYLTVAKAANAVGNCDATDYLLGATTATALPAQVMPATYDASKAVALTWTAVDLAKNGTGVVTGAIGFANKTGANQDGCKGATVTINYVAS